MKSRLIAFLGVICLSSLLHGDEKEHHLDLENAVAPPMMFTTALPVSISTENKQLYQSNAEINSIEMERTIAALDKRTFPWTYFVSALASIVAIVLIRTTASVERETKEDLQLAERLRWEALEQLKKLVIGKPIEVQSPDTFFLTLDDALRKYLDAEYHIGAIVSTAQELSASTDALSELDPAVRKNIGNIFYKAEQIKFARGTSSAEDKLMAIQTISSLINSPLS